MKWVALWVDHVLRFSIIKLPEMGPQLLCFYVSLLYLFKVQSTSTASDPVATSNSVQVWDSRNERNCPVGLYIELISNCGKEWPDSVSLVTIGIGDKVQNFKLPSDMPLLMICVSPETSGVVKLSVINNSSKLIGPISNVGDTIMDNYMLCLRSTLF